jgi:trans-aconitate 2-methyltransferase
MEHHAVRWNATDYHQHASAQTAWGREVHARLDLRGDEVVIDLGCGDGRLTADLAGRLPGGRVVGGDADPDMIAFAQRHHARENVRFVLADARRFDVADELDRPADLVVSTATLHWVAEQEAVLRRCRAHLSPGGRLLFQMGGRGNCAEIIGAAQLVACDPRWSRWLQPFTTPWRFHGPEEYLRWLERAGFRPLRVQLAEKDMVHDGPEALAAWIRTTWMPVLGRVPAPLRPALVEAVVEQHLILRPRDAAGRTHAAMVRLDVEAVAG